MRARAPTCRSGEELVGSRRESVRRGTRRQFGRAVPTPRSSSARQAPAPPWSWIASCSTSVFEDPLGVVLQTIGALLETTFSFRARRGPEDVAKTDFSVPPSEALEILLLLVELGRRELLGADLLVDLLVELGALGEELGPLLLTLGSEHRLQSCGHRVSARDRVQDDRFSVRSLDQLDGPGHRIDEVLARR